MNFCHQFSVYNQEIVTMMAVVFSMLMFSKFGKKSREEAAYISVVGVSLMVLTNLFFANILSSFMCAVDTSSHVFMQPIWTSFVMTVIITVLLMVIGKQLKVKTTAPKVFALCFFVGILAANCVSMCVEKQCSAPTKKAKHQG